MSYKVILFAVNSPMTICSILQPQNNRHFKYPIFSVTFSPHLEQKVMEKLCVQKSIRFGMIQVWVLIPLLTYSNLGPVNLTLPVPHCFLKQRSQLELSEKMIERIT